MTHRGSLDRTWRPASWGLLVFGDDADMPLDSSRPGHIAAAIQGRTRGRPWDQAECRGAHAVRPKPKRTTLAFEEYVRLSALLMEPTTDRGSALVARGLTEDRWLVEETAWLGRMGNEAMDGDTSLAVLYGELLMRERALLARPDEDRNLAEYARARADSSDRDPSLCSRHGLRCTSNSSRARGREAERTSAPTGRHLLAIRHARLDAWEPRDAGLSAR